MFEIVLRRKSFFFNTVMDSKYDQTILIIEHILIKKNPKLRTKKSNKKNPPKTNKRNKKKTPKQTFIKYEYIMRNGGECINRDFITSWGWGTKSHKEKVI